MFKGALTSFLKELCNSKRLGMFGDVVLKKIPFIGKNNLYHHCSSIQKLASKFAQTDVFDNLVITGIAPDGSVDWPAAGIVQALLEASTALAIEGWTPVASAERWIAETYPDQRPAKYGCSSWRQVVHQSHVFELRYRETDGRRAAWYRVKQTNA